MSSRLSWVAGVFLAVVASHPLAIQGEEPGWAVGLARAKITPTEPIAMCGYGPRISSGVLDELYAEAMAIDHGGGERGLLLTADLLFFRAPFAEALCQDITQRTGLARRQIQLNGSHTHAGPVFGIRIPNRFDLTEEQERVVRAYTKRLQAQLVELAVAALAEMKPARLYWGNGDAGSFVMNRRLLDEHGKCRGMGPNPEGPVDRTVPVLRVEGHDGRPRAVVFGCACHPVTLDGNNRKISGDYAGYARRYIEREHPGVQAMFVIGCAADANTHPRGGENQEEMARRHGKTLGAEVCRVAAGDLQPVRGPLRVALAWMDLPLERSLPRAEWEKTASGNSYWHARNAKGMLECLDRDEPLPAHYRAPLAVWQFGHDLTLVGLPGEAVVEYVSLLRDALGPERLWIAAYSNDSFGYLPTAKILAGSGHETIGLTLDVGLFSPQVENVVVAEVRRLADRAGRALPTVTNAQETQRE